MTERDESGTPVEPEPEPATATAASRRQGRIRQQDENTTPREPTLAERRARERVARRRREEEEQRAADEAAGRKKRRRVLVGAGVTVGVVALIAVGYAAAQPDDEVQANCVDESGVIVDDSNCATPAPNQTYTGGGGFAFFPIFLGAGGRQYHYNYGGTGTIGQTVSGGTTTVPRDGTPVRTSSGSSTVTRGGLGVSRSSSTGGGSFGSNGSSGGSKSGTSGGQSVEARGMITTQFVNTPSGWKISAMAWDDERPGLSIPE